jgi:hypothetical protein
MRVSIDASESNAEAAPFRVARLQGVDRSTRYQNTPRYCQRPALRCGRRRFAAVM